MRRKAGDIAPGEWELIWPRLRHGSKLMLGCAIIFPLVYAGIMLDDYRTTGRSPLTFDPLDFLFYPVYGGFIVYLFLGCGVAPRTLGSVWARGGAVRFISLWSDVEFTRESTTVGWPRDRDLRGHGNIRRTTFRRGDGLKRSITMNYQGVHALKALWNAGPESRPSSPTPAIPLNPPA